MLENCICFLTGSHRKCPNSSYTRRSSGPWPLLHHQYIPWNYLFYQSGTDNRRFYRYAWSWCPDKNIRMYANLLCISWDTISGWSNWFWPVLARMCGKNQIRWSVDEDIANGIWHIVVDGGYGIVITLLIGCLTSWANVCNFTIIQ